MRRVMFLIVLISSLVALATPAAHAQYGSDEAYPFKLVDDSNFQVGCLEPCDCPIFMRPVGGGFTLVPREPNPLFFNYAVVDVRWSLPNHDGSVVDVVGSGIYQIGGEVALTHRLQLDLSVAGQPVQSFDSGYVVGGWSFPRIEIPIAVNEFFCFDSVFVLRAESLVPLAVGEASAADRLRPQPNPFHDGTDLAFSLPATGTVSLSIIDIAGRDVSTLVDATMFPAGRHTVAWNGRGADGRMSPPGVYFVRLDIGGRHLVRRLVKLE